MSQVSQKEKPLSRVELYEILQGLKGSDLEYFLAELWDSTGWETEVTSANQDRGIDVVATQSSPLPLRVLIQAKGYGSSSTVSSPEVQQYSSLKQQDNEADLVAIVTTGEFSEPARQIGESLDIKLVDVDSLVDTVVKADAYELLDPYMNEDLFPESDNKETDGILSEDPVVGSDLNVDGHLSKGEQLQSLVPAEEYQDEEATLLVHSSNRGPRISSNGQSERISIEKDNRRDTSPTYLHLTTEGVHLFVRTNDDDRHEFFPYKSITAVRVETALFGPIETLKIRTTDEIDVEYEYEDMETGQERCLRSVFNERVGIDPFN